MRIFLLVSLLLIPAIVLCEEAQTQTTSQKQEDTQKQKSPVLVYPKELLKPLPEMPIPNDATKEFVEVESEANPSLNINLPTLDELLDVKRGGLKGIRPQEPMRGQDYYTRGGSILTMYGVHEPSGQLFNYSPPIDSEEDEEDED